MTGEKTFYEAVTFVHKTRQKVGLAIGIWDGCKGWKRKAASRKRAKTVIWARKMKKIRIPSP